MHRPEERPHEAAQRARRHQRQRAERLGLPGGKIDFNRGLLMELEIEAEFATSLSN